MNGQVLKEFFAYDAGMTFGVTVAAADVTGDGVPEIITAPGQGGGPHVKIWNVAGTPTTISSYFAYAPTFTGGVYVAAGDLNFDGRADIVTGAGPGGAAHVRAFSGTSQSLLTEFFAYPTTFGGGVRVSVGDTTGSGENQIITGAGTTGGPHVRTFDRFGTLTCGFFAYDPTMTQGVYVAGAPCDDSVVDLNIEGVAEPSETSLGGLVIRNYDGNNAQRKKLTLDTSASSGILTLTRSNTKVRVFTAAAGGTEITFNDTDNKFMAAELPKDLYVEGATASNMMRDVELTLSNFAGAFDQVKFTVLWVTVSTRHSGTVSTDDAAKGGYEIIGVPPSLELTYRLHQNAETATWLGRGSEFIGVVSPNDFVPSQFGTTQLYLDRNVVNGNQWWGATGNENSRASTAQSDTSSTSLRDDDPQSDGSSGRIYDLDAPGINAVWAIPDNWIFRYRSNYEAWAMYGSVRVSEVKPWNTRQSYKLSGPRAFGMATSSGEFTLTDTTQNWQANEWANGVIKITAGTGNGTVGRVVANTATTITIGDQWATQPDQTSEFQIVNTNTWVIHNDIPNDNQNRDGATPITWNLQ